MRDGVRVGVPDDRARLVDERVARPVGRGATTPGPRSSSGRRGTGTARGRRAGSPRSRWRRASSRTSAPRSSRAAACAASAPYMKSRKNTLRRPGVGMRQLPAVGAGDVGRARAAAASRASQASSAATASCEVKTTRSPEASPTPRFRVRPCPNSAAEISWTTAPAARARRRCRRSEPESTTTISTGSSIAWHGDSVEAARRGRRRRS